jgi:hypothetical protein
VLLVIGAMALIVLFRVRPTARAAGLAALFVGVAFAAALPWATRNRGVLGKMVFSTTGVGASLYDGVGPDADGSSNMEFLNRMSELDGMSELERDAYLREKSIAAIKADPTRAAKLALVKAWRFWTPVPNSAGFRSWPYMAASLAAVLPVYLFVLVALVRRVVSARDLVFLAAAPVAFTLLHMIFVGSTRYRAPVMPFVIIIAAAGAVSLMGTRRGKTANGAEES